ncbi:hypothetical protein N9P58_02905 [Puniceicoccaceae bacterium]|nr:hypothetical protein [Puniceicoccaceae bacterium]
MPHKQMKHALKLLTLSLLAVTFLGCTKANPYLGQWHMSAEGKEIVFEILEGGNLLASIDGRFEVGRWLATEEGIVIVAKNGKVTPGFLNEETLLIMGDPTFRLKRVKR